MSYSVYSETEHTLRCVLCPHMCTLKEGESGICRIRSNLNGDISLAYRGLLSSIALDPIEKKPLYHFFPGKKILSVGFFGCNLRCPFCQNYSISQHAGREGDAVTPEELVALAHKKKSFGIAYTYSEPLVHFEYVLDSCRIAKAEGLQNVLVTNGHLNLKPAAELLAFVDAANIDLKSYSADFYRNELKGSLEAVKAFIRIAFDSGVHIEVTTLVIPSKNDCDEEIRSLSAFIASIDPGIPYHLSCYYPAYHYDVPPTNPERVMELVDIAGEYLAYVYPGNVGHRTIDTRCSSCGEILIKRAAYKTEVLSFGQRKCLNCGCPVDIPGVF